MSLSSTEWPNTNGEFPDSTFHKLIMIALAGIAVTIPSGLQGLFSTPKMTVPSIEAPEEQGKPVPSVHAENITKQKD